MGVAVGCALLTKGTAYLFLPPLLIGVLFLRMHYRRVLLAVVIAAGINAPHYSRNQGLSGSVLGFDSAQGDGFFRWRNETFGWKQTVSNGLRHLSRKIRRSNLSTPESRTHRNDIRLRSRKLPASWCVWIAGTTLGGLCNTRGSRRRRSQIGSSSTSESVVLPKVKTAVRTLRGEISGRARS